MLVSIELVQLTAFNECVDMLASESKLRRMLSTRLKILALTKVRVGKVLTERDVSLMATRLWSKLSVCFPPH